MPPHVAGMKSSRFGVPMFTVTRRTRVTLFTSWRSDDFISNTFLRFDPNNETFTVIKIPSAGANVRQILGVPGEIWGAESGTDKIISIKTGP